MGKSNRAYTWMHLGLHERICPNTPIRCLNSYEIQSLLPYLLCIVHDQCASCFAINNTRMTIVDQCVFSVNMTFLSVSLGGSPNLWPACVEGGYMEQL
jgi:hypothetical protein